jgi:uncharacterized protein (DUF2062 family)
MDLKTLFQRYLPKQQYLREHRHLRFLGPYLRHAGPWRLNRRSAARGVALGLFVAFIPLPVHMLLVACLAILFRVNLPISVLAVWVSNPITWAPQIIFSYKAGVWLMGGAPAAPSFEPSIEGITELLSHSWQPFLLGCLVLGAASAVLGHMMIQGLWRWFFIRKWRKRRCKRKPLARTQVEGNA